MTVMKEEKVKRICPTCGRVLEEDFLSCPYCGRSLISELPTKPAKKRNIARWIAGLVLGIILLFAFFSIVSRARADGLALLFDSDNNGELTTVALAWQESTDDHGVFIGADNISTVYAKCYIYIRWGYYNNSVRTRGFWCWDFHPDFIAYFNNSYCIYREGEGYTFKLSIPRELINVEPPTPIHVSFTDDDVMIKEVYIRNKTYKDTIAADFTG